MIKGTTLPNNNIPNALMVQALRSPINQSRSSQPSKHLRVPDNAFQGPYGSPMTELPLWTTLESKDTSSSREYDLNEDPMIQSSPPKGRKTALEISHHFQSGYPSPPTTMSTATDTTILPLPTLKQSEKPRVSRFDGVAIPKVHIRFKTESPKSMKIGPPTKIAKYAHKKDGIMKCDSLASALSDSFAQNGLEVPLLSEDSLHVSHPQPHQLQNQRAIPPSVRPDHNHVSSLPFLRSTHIIDRELNTVEAQITYPMGDVSNDSRPVTLSLPNCAIQSDFRTDRKTRRVGTISEDQGMVAGFVERLEKLFGPGDIHRGSGRKPTQRGVQVSAIASESDVGIASDASSQITGLAPSAINKSRPGKRKRADSDEEAESRVLEMTEKSDMISLSVATEWAEILQKLIKGKVAVSQQELAKIYETVVLVDRVEISTEVLKESGLYQRMLQLSELWEIPAFGERDLRSEAEALAVRWRAVGELA